MPAPDNSGDRSSNGSADYFLSSSALFLQRALSSLRPVGELVDVTVPVQCLVEDNSRLTLYESASKADLAGFHDPAPTDDDKRLLVRYLYQGRVHQVVFGDLEGAKMPRTAHRL